MNSNNTTPESLINQFIKDDLKKFYFLMILSGVPAGRANFIIFNLKNSDIRANSVQIRNMLIRILKELIIKLINDPLLYNRAKTLAIQNDFHIFEGIKQHLSKSLTEEDVSNILNKLKKINNKSKTREIATNIVNFMEMDTTSGIAGLPPDDPVVKKKKGANMIVRRGKMAGNPSYVVETDAYTKALNGILPEEISEALNETGIVVLENKDTENMIFLFTEQNKKAPSNMDQADFVAFQNTKSEENEPDDEDEAEASLSAFQEIRKKRMIASGMSPEEAHKKAKAPLKHRGDNPGKG